MYCRVLRILPLGGCQNLEDRESGLVGNLLEQGLASRILQRSCIKTKLSRMAELQIIALADIRQPPNRPARKKRYDMQKASGFNHLPTR